MMLDKLKKYLIRRKTPVLFDDIHRIEPISSHFGVDRGTPIDRYYIEQFLNAHRQLIRGRLLEIGEASYCRKFGTEPVSIDVLHFTAGNPAATIVGDLTAPASLPQGTIDCFICTQTFNFIFEVNKAVAGAAHLLAPGGVLIGTVAGISQISRHDMDRWGDYWRFTDLSVRKLLEPHFGKVTVSAFGNPAACKLMLDGCAVEDLPDPKILAPHHPDYQLLIGFIAEKV